jgi:hypothetical protein
VIAGATSAGLAFPSSAVGVALPYGLYDMGANTGWVNVGTDHDTAVFAVESLRRW